MTNSKRSLRTSRTHLITSLPPCGGGYGWGVTLWLVLILFGAASASRADVAGGGNYDLTKVLIGASGVTEVTASSYTIAYALGEDAAGTESQGGGYDLISGYFGSLVGIGNGQGLQLLNVTVSSATLIQNGIPIGVPLNASLQLNFSDQLDPSTLAGIQVQVVTDNMGQSQQTFAAIQSSYSVAGTTVTVAPQGTWAGNTLYNVVLTPSLRSIDGFMPVGSSPFPFLTLLNPQQENVVAYPITMSGSMPGAPGSGSNAAPVYMQIAAQSLSDYSAVVVNTDPLNHPLRIDPQLILGANAKALASGGPYAAPLALQEIVVYGQSGEIITTLAQPAELTLGFSGTAGTAGGSGSLIRAGTLAIWALDTTHDLWVKIPSSQISGQGMVTAPITQFSVFALMGAASGSTADTSTFPDPWRPHGPDAGSGSGQTGTDAGGMTFTNLPSECSIKIYTLSGHLVQTLNHSDVGGTIGQEVWNGRTASGEIAASGVYLWRVQSSTDGKNGKLMIIR